MLTSNFKIKRIFLEIFYGYRNVSQYKAEFRVAAGPGHRENREFFVTWTNREMTGNFLKMLIKNDFNFF